MLLIYTFQVRYCNTRIDTSPIQFNPISKFGIVLPNEDANNTVVKFTLICIATVIPIITPRDEDMETLLVYEITIPLFWDPSSKLRTENEVATQKGTNFE